MERQISVGIFQTKSVDPFQSWSRIFRSEETETDYSIWTLTEISGISGIMESTLWRKNWTSKSTILKESAGKVESVFVIRSAQCAEKLGCCLEYCRSWKLRSENLRLRSTRRPFDSRFERKGALVTVEICVLCGRWFSNQFEIVLETPFSCDADGRELLWAVLCWLLCRELDWNTRKQGYVFILSDLEVMFWFFAFLNLNQCVKNFLPPRKVEFIKWNNLINVLFIGFVKQWFSDCGLLENFYWSIF